MTKLRRVERAMIELSALLLVTPSYLCDVGTPPNIHATGMIGGNPEFIEVSTALSALRKMRERLVSGKPNPFSQVVVRYT